MISAIALGLFVGAGVVGAGRVVTGPQLADRVVALDVMLICFMGAVTVDAARRGASDSLTTLIVLAVVGFTATVSAARFLEHIAGTDAGV